MSEKIDVHQTSVYVDCKRDLKCIWSYLNNTTMFLEPFQHVYMYNYPLLANKKFTSFDDLSQHLIESDPATFENMAAMRNSADWPWINFVYVTKSNKIFPLNIMRNEAIAQQSQSSPKLLVTPTFSSAVANKSADNIAVVSKSKTTKKTTSKKTLVDNITILTTYLDSLFDHALVNIIAMQSNDSSKREHEENEENFQILDFNECHHVNLVKWKIKENDWSLRTPMQKLNCFLKNNNGRGCFTFYLKHSDNLIVRLQTSKLITLFSRLDIEYLIPSSDDAEKHLNSEKQLNADKKPPLGDKEKNINTIAVDSVEKQIVLSLQDFKICKKHIKSMSQPTSLYFFDLN